MSYIYIGSVIFFWLTLISFAYEIKNELKSIGIVIPAKEVIMLDFLKPLIVSLIPILNIILGFMYLFSGDVKKAAVDENVKKYKQN